MIKTKCIFEKPEKDDGFRILVSRNMPKKLPPNMDWIMSKGNPFAVDEWMKDLAPSNFLIDKYRNGALNWEGFAKYYKIEMRNDKQDKIIKGLNRMSSKNTITLLCIESDLDNCHRTILRDIILDYSLRII